MRGQPKFRAWSPKWDKMIYHGVDNYTIDVHANTAWNEGCDDECIQLMQLTGFHCKKKEVYEFDIIKHPKATEPEEKGWIVVWKDFGWKLKCINLVNGEEIFTEFSDYFANECDLIGNEFENPELTLA